MRCIAGTARGVQLLAPPGLATRPTGDRMKEDLFNILAPFVPGNRFLDVFSGTGAIAVEAASRGAAAVVCVENAAEALDALRRNLQKTRLSGRVRVLGQDFQTAISLLTGENFDIIFLDPPYGKNLPEAAIALILRYRLLAAGGRLVVEQQVNDPLPRCPYKWIRQKKYATAQFLFYENCSDASPEAL